MNDLSPLKRYFTSNGQLDESIRVCDVVNIEGNWDVHWLLQVLPRDVVHRIQAYHPALNEFGMDQLSWRWMVAGKFSMRETYKQLGDTSSSSHLEADSIIWKLTTPQRVRTFLWFFIRKKLLSNAECTRRGMSSSLFCDQCGSSIETTLHAVRDCAFAKAVWKLLVPNHEWNGFFSFVVGDWIQWNIRNTGQITGNGWEWPTLSSIVCWFLWKHRNDFVFNKGSSSKQDLIAAALV